MLFHPPSPSVVSRSLELERKDDGMSPNLRPSTSSPNPSSLSIPFDISCSLLLPSPDLPQTPVTKTQSHAE
ncbi:hypothetical protein ONZ45_g17215 [Pleurotus djamor]|nr:hypothetical protein ONZ45_g17215 [Pleurotus djamor]